MKKLMSFLAVAILFATFIPAVEARTTVSLDFFYDNLDPYGSWREVGDYGYCWQPSNVDEGWRPYSDGRWVYTDAGWTWDSDEPYGWAVYHYGRWANVEDVGWVWVPDTVWGPAWVSWRHSPRYVGWAPLPPEARFLLTIGFSAWVDDYYDIGPSNYRFVEGRDFGSRRLNSVFVDQRQNITIINQTTNITNITYVNNTVYNQGPNYQQLSSQSAQPISRYTLDRRQSVASNSGTVSPENLKPRVQGSSLSVFAPPIAESSTAAPRKLAPKVAAAQVNHGWKNAGSPTEVAETRAKLKSNAKIPDALPPQPKFQKLSEKAASSDTPPATGRPRPPIAEEKTTGERMSKGGKQEARTLPVLTEKPKAVDAPITPPSGQKPKVNEKLTPPAATDPSNPLKKRQEQLPQSHPQITPPQVPEKGSTSEPSDNLKQGGKKKLSDPQHPRADEVLTQPRIERKPKIENTVPQQSPPKPLEPKHPDAVKPAPRPQTPPALEPPQLERGKIKPDDKDKKKPEDAPK